MITNVAILASGSGTNAENITRYFMSSPDVHVSLILTNSQKAFALQRARNLGIPCAYFSKEFWQDGEAVLGLLKAYNIGFVVLAGFLAKIPDAILRAYPHRMVNIHPSLLPLHGGKGMYGDKVHEDVVRCGDKQSGITIHYVNEKFDNGDIIFQATCPVEPTDDAHAVAEKVHALEYAHFPHVIDETIQKL